MKVFILTFFGLFIPICFVEILGAALMTIVNEDYTNAFENGGTGGLLSQVLSPWKGGGKFILFLLAFSVMYASRFSQPTHEIHPLLMNLI